MTWEEWIERLLERLHRYRQQQRKVDLTILMGRIDPTTGQPRVEVREHGL